MKYIIDDYLNYLKIEKRLAKNTYESYYFDMLTFYEYFKEKDIKKIIEQDIVEYLKYLNIEKKLSSRTIERHLTTIKGLYKYLIRENKIKKDITENIDNIKLGKYLPVTLTLEETEELLNIKLENVFNYRTKAMLELMYGSGLRVSELVNLTTNDIDTYNNTIIINGKGQKERIVPLSEYSKYYLQEYLKRRYELIKKKYGNQEKLFLNNHGQPITRNGFNYLIKELLKEKKINKNVTPHTLRHSFATHMLDGGADIKTIQELLGHSDIVTTKIYTHISKQKVKNDYNVYQTRGDEDEI